MDHEAVPTTQLTDAMQSFPRIMLFEFQNDASEPERPVASLQLLDAWPNAFPDGPVTLPTGKRQGYAVPGKIGDSLTNNSPTDDGYRFHDAFHIGIMTRLGWSPVMRALLDVKRRSIPQIDEVDDGARAIIFEESLFDFMGMAGVEANGCIEEETTLLFASLSVQQFLKTRTVASSAYTQIEIQEALLEGARLFQAVRRNLGGYVIANLDAQAAIFRPKDAGRPHPTV